MNKTIASFFLLFAFLSLTTFSSFAQKSPIEYSDIMKFQSIKQTVISDDGDWVAYQAQPDRGDAIGYVHNANSNTTFEVELGTKPVFSDNSQFVAFIQPPSLLNHTNATPKERKKLSKQLVVLNLSTGERTHFNHLDSFQFSSGSQYLAVLAKTPSPDNQESGDKSINKKKKLYNKGAIGDKLVVIDLQSNQSHTYPNVASFAFSTNKQWLALATSTKTGEQNAIDVINLTTEQQQTLFQEPALSIEQLAWSDKGTKLAFLKGSYQEKVKKRSHSLHIWHSTSHFKTIKTNKKGWFISNKHPLKWSFDSKRVFFGYSPSIISKTKSTTLSQSQLFDVNTILAKKEMQTWHHQDTTVKTQDKVDYNKKNYDYYLASVNVKRSKVVQLADKSLQDIRIVKNRHALIGIDYRPYQRQSTWNGWYFDAYRIDLNNGNKSLIAKNIQHAGALKISEDGRYISFIKEGHLWAYDSVKQKSKQLSTALGQIFVDENNDRPQPARPYGIKGWLKGTDKLIAYDKFDIWQFDFSSTKALKLTSGFGREHHRRLRIINTDKEQPFISDNDLLLLSSFNTDTKQSGFFTLVAKSRQLSKLLEGDHRYRFIAKAKNKPSYVFTRESYREFPDLWLAQSSFSNAQKISQLGKQTTPYIWGDSELISWQTNDGDTIQGRLIKPDNFDTTKRYPVLVYFYENYSDRLHHFTPMVINHRPNFPFYNSHGYVIFQPDIKQIIGQPGDAMVKSIVPGVQKIIELGIADKNAIGLHGHSWGGYGTAYAVTQTDIFKAAVSGAPVSNMTSAYSGIRLKSGLARQFQYETGQSRLGASLWEQRQLYIDSSPLFFADRVNTPLLIQFGDVDDAVPWQQGVELFLALRRLDKDAIMLQYEGEPHHLKKYPNKLDYTIKMKEYFDHYLLNKPAPQWINEGEAFRPAPD
ncbi:prolyl oligopeptidase family serine peptidase [Psychrobium sp. 1_MG-2023]|uniref:prolyl oligopeptidase family serine peptidase n=1 Tax=Psychrobium sp. 1_MG-2023 TaxID=3062624 RepID=UPI000C347817|nr:prolyl oligopeptidase family serine peptidase [Psychrobium sp. 1_MG-2023]MDP2560341.1 prolyl oligopeptidase family serine peptidase [Psychrobium sp. 1_MG-2023]PKF55452.1 S9 family peptidase [Alteromonadales bacterium alter-6D02]